MSSSNSFNVCPRCGKANALNAKYCSSCGQQLAVPQEVIVCHKCHRTNSPMASFCGACGAPLRVGAQTKICPKCHKEVDVNDNVCSCGYSFGNVKYATPESVSGSESSHKAASIGKRKGGRAGAVIAFVLLLVFAYLIFAPYQVAKNDGSGNPALDGSGNPIVTTLRPTFLAELDKGILFFPYSGLDGGVNFYGFEMIASVIDAIVSDPVTSLESLKTGFGVGGLALTVLVVVVALSAVVQLITYLARIIGGGRNKRKNVFFLIMAILSTLWVGLAVLFGTIVTAESSQILQKIAAVFVPNATLGYVAYLIPVYFWLFFIVSLCTKSKKVKEAVA